MRIHCLQYKNQKAYKVCNLENKRSSKYELLVFYKVCRGWEKWEFIKNEPSKKRDERRYRKEKENYESRCNIANRSWVLAIVQIKVNYK